MAVINSSAIGEGSPMNEKRQVQKMNRRENHLALAFKSSKLSSTTCIGMSASAHAFNIQGSIREL
jgi:hypothetical protein